MAKANGHVHFALELWEILMILRSILEFILVKNHFNAWSVDTNSIKKVLLTHISGNSTIFKTNLGFLFYKFFSFCFIWNFNDIFLQILKPISNNFLQIEPIRIGQGLAEYACPFCDKIMKKLYDMKRHILVHTDKKPFTCTICGHKTKLKFNLVSRIRKQHPHIQTNIWKHVKNNVCFVRSCKINKCLLDAYNYLLFGFDFSHIFQYSILLYRFHNFCISL